MSAMEEVRFPVRCGWGRPFVTHDEPALAAVQLEFTCGCPNADQPACAGHVEELPVGFVSTNRSMFCLRCNAQAVNYTVIGQRPLNEGDLPDD